MKTDTAIPQESKIPYSLPNYYFFLLGRPGGLSACSPLVSGGKNNRLQGFSLTAQIL